MEDQIMNLRIASLETRLAAIEGRLVSLEHISTASSRRRKRELSPEERTAIRERLVAGKAAKKEREIAEATAKAAEAEKANKKKEANRGASTAEK